jgi:uncharacterized protein (DUF302 family)
MAPEEPCATCERLFALLDREGEADVALLQEAEAHLAECQRCRRAATSLSGLIRQYRVQSHPTLPPGLEARLLEYLCEPYEIIERSNPMQHSYGFGTTVYLPFEEAVEQVTAALKEEGFGVLTTIDVRQTLKQKLDVEFEPYVILGACNPTLAHRALTTVHDIGLLLPCNVIVHAHGEQTRVDIADPSAMLGIVQEAALDDLAADARARLERALQHLEESAGAQPST